MATDNRFIDDVLSGNTLSPDQYPLQKTFDRLAKMEAIAAGMQKGREVLHIGTGWPGTAIGLYGQFGIPVTCVEKDLGFAERSSKGLRKLDLLGKGKLQVICADGSEINTEKYQTVIISAMVPNEDKEKIIQNMKELATDDLSDPVLMLRTPSDSARRLFYPALSNEILEMQCLTKIADTGSFVGSMDPIRSLVFKIRAMAAVRRGEDYIMLSARNRLHFPLSSAA